jgi:hypothetical protein
MPIKQETTTPNTTQYVTQDQTAVINRVEPEQENQAITAKVHFVYQYLTQDSSNSSKTCPYCEARPKY